MIQNFVKFFANIWSKMTRKRKKKSVVESGNLSQEYNEVWYEMETHRYNLKLLTDTDLIDAVSQAIDVYEAKDIDKIYNKLYNKKSITPAERAKLEGFYILVNGDLTCQE